MRLEMLMIFSPLLLGISKSYWKFLRLKERVVGVFRDLLWVGIAGVIAVPVEQECSFARLAFFAWK